LFIFGRLTFVTTKFFELCGVQVWVRSKDGLDWIRTIANFVDFGLDPECKALQNEDLERIWTELMEKKWGIFVCIFPIFWIHLDLKIFWTVVGLGLSSKKSGLDLDRKI